MSVYKQGDFYLIMDVIGLTSDGKISCNFGYYKSKEDAIASLDGNYENNLGWFHIICEQVEGEEHSVTATREFLQKMPSLEEV